MLTTREAIAIKVQTEPGTKATPDPSADSILMSSPTIANAGLRMLARENVKPTISTDQQVFGGSLKSLSFTVELKGSGTAGTPPECGQALRCCGLDETIVAGTSVTYQPVTLGHEYATIYYYQDGRLNELYDAVGNVTLNAEAGNFGTLQFEFTGRDGGLVDATFPALSYNSTIPKPFIDAPFSIDSFNAVVGNFSLNAGNNIVTPASSRDKEGFSLPRISKRDPNGTVDPEAATVGVKDFVSAFKNGTRMSLNSGTVGVAGNSWQVLASIALRDIAPGDRDQVRTDQLTYAAHEINGDDEFQLIFA